MKKKVLSLSIACMFWVRDEQNAEKTYYPYSGEERWFIYHPGVSQAVGIPTNHLQYR